MLADHSDPNSLSTKLRRRRDVQLRALIEHCAARNGRASVLDIGGTVDYWRRVGVDFLRANGVTVTILNLSESEIAGGAGEADIFTRQIGDGCDMPQFDDGQFDLAHSNSVIEHVVTWPQMKSFASEVRRVASSYYVQTPYFWFPVDPHYYKAPMFHWFPRPIRAQLLNALPIAHCGRIDGVDKAFEVVDQARLLDSRQFHFLFPDASVTFERFLGLKKSLIAIRRA